MKLPVKHDEQEHEVVINGVMCSFCGKKEFPEFAGPVGEASACEDCIMYVFND